MAWSAPTQPTIDSYWTLDHEHLERQLRSGPNGLSQAEADRRLEIYGPNDLRAQPRVSHAVVFGRQLRNPLLVLMAATMNPR